MYQKNEDTSLIDKKLLECSQGVDVGRFLLLPTQSREFSSDPEFTLDEDEIELIRKLRNSTLKRINSAEKNRQKVEIIEQPL